MQAVIYISLQTALYAHTKTDALTRCHLLVLVNARTDSFLYDQIQIDITVLKHVKRLGMVAHTCNPSTLGG